MTNPKPKVNLTSLRDDELSALHGYFAKRCFNAVESEDPKVRATYGSLLKRFAKIMDEVVARKWAKVGGDHYIRIARGLERVEN